MSPHGDADLVEVRAALLDALEALADHRGSVVVIGAQAIYLHTGEVTLALAESTYDSDLALDPRTLTDQPLVEQAMASAGFGPNPITRQPGAWVNARGIPVDLMVPEALAGPSASQRRGGRIPPHDRTATRRARGLEAAVVDRSQMVITALGAGDPRSFTASVAGPAALLVAKLHKLGERQDAPDRRVDKDAYDTYRLLAAIATDALAEAMANLLQDVLPAPVTRQALIYLEQMFATPIAMGSVMAGRAEEGIGQPDTVAAAVSTLAGDLLAAVRS